MAKNNITHTRLAVPGNTEEKEKKLQSRFLSDLFLQAPMAICILRGPRHIVELINEKMLGIWGRKLEQVMNQPVFDAMPDATGQGYEQILDNVYRTGQRFVTEELPVSLLRNGKKERIFIKFVCEPFIKENGTVSGIIAVADEITDQVNARKIIEESENKYRQLLENLPVAVYTTDAGGYITLYNEAAAELWGQRPEIGKDMWCGSWKIYETDGVTPISLDSCPMVIALKEGRVVHGKEVVIERPDGARKNIIPHPRPVFDPSGKITGASNTLIDISDRKVTDEYMARFEAIIQSSDEIIISKTLDGIITSWNPAAGELFGYAEDEMIGQSVTKIIPSDRLDEESRILERIRNGQKIENFETKRMTKDGRLIDISLTISPIKDLNGKIIGASKIVHDITRQNLLNEALRASEERLRMAGESAKLGTWEFHPLTKKLIWSAECKRIYGFPEDMEPDNQFVVAHSYLEDADLIREEVQKVMDPDNKKSFQIQYRIIREPDKQIRWLKVRGKVFFDDNRMPDRFIGTMMDITEEKQALQLISESEERLRMAIQSTQLGTWEYHVLTGKLIWSDECRKIYEVPDDREIDYNFFIKHIHPEDKEYAETEIKNAMDAGGSGDYNIQYRILRYSDRQPRWIKAQGKVYFNANRQPERFIGTVLDITKEKIQEQELKDSVELFQTMADNVPAMIWMSGTDKFNDYFNKTWLQFTGRSSEDECNEGWLEGVHPDDRQKCIDTYHRSFNEQKGFYTEYRLRRHDGEYRWIADNCIPRFSPGRQFLGFISACMDIDDQKRFREKIKDSELLFKTISNTSPAALWMTDKNKKNVFVSDTWLQWTGRTFDEQINRGWLSMVLEEDREQVIARFFECFEERKDFMAEFRIPNAENEIRWCLTEGKPYFDVNGLFAGYAGSVTDITEIKKMEQRKDDFIKMASHELKTPVTTIKGYIQLLLKINENEKNAFLSESLYTIDKQVSKLSKLIADLLDATKIETGKLQINSEVFRVGEIIKELIKDARTTSIAHTIMFNQNADPLVLADKDRITQVLSNLISNAVKYSPDASKIIIETKLDNKEIIVSVQDFGIGIAPQDHDKIFERFYRVSDKLENTFPGFGIGLFIVKEIISLHKGRLWVDSAKGKGSVFYFSLPVYDEN